MRNPPKPQVPGLCGWDKQALLVELSVSRCDRHGVILKVILSFFFLFSKVFARFIHMWFNVSTSLKSPARINPTLHMGNHLWEVNNIVFVSNYKLAWPHLRN